MTSLGNGTYCDTLNCLELNADEINRLNTRGNLTFTKDNETKWSLGMTANNNLVLQNEVADVEPSLIANFDTGHVTILGGGSGGAENLTELNDVITTGIQNNELMTYDSNENKFIFTSDLSVNDISAISIHVSTINAGVVVTPQIFSSFSSQKGFLFSNNIINTLDKFGNIPSGDIIMGTDLSVNGRIDAIDASFQNITLQGSAVIGTDLSVNGRIDATDASFQNVEITNDLSVNGHLNATDASFHNVEITNDLSVNTLDAYSATIGHNLTVNGQINTIAKAIPDTSHYNVLKSYVPDIFGVFHRLAGSIDTEVEVVSNTKRMHLTTSGFGVSEGLTITSDGHVGIGIQHPTVDLEVNGDISLNGGIYATDLHSTNVYVTQLHANFLTTKDAATSLKIFSDESSSSRLGIDISQNIISGCNQLSDTGLPVIIGHDLSVNGSITCDGTVGIGTVSPTEKLDVNGNIKLSGTLLVGATPSNGTSGQVLVSKGASSPEWESPIYFYAKKQTTTQHTSNAEVPVTGFYNVNQTNGYSMFHPLTGVFTAPITGTYLVNYSANIHDGNTPHLEGIGSILQLDTGSGFNNYKFNYDSVVNANTVNQVTAQINLIINLTVGHKIRHTVNVYMNPAALFDIRGDSSLVGFTYQSVNLIR